MSRQRVLVDTSDHEAIKRRMYQLYEVKEYVTACQQTMSLTVQSTVQSRSSPAFTVAPFYPLCSFLLNLCIICVEFVCSNCVVVIVVVVLYMF